MLLFNHPETQSACQFFKSINWNKMRSFLFCFVFGSVASRHWESCPLLVANSPLTPWRRGLFFLTFVSVLFPPEPVCWVVASACPLLVFSTVLTVERKKSGGPWIFWIKHFFKVTNLSHKITMLLGSLHSNSFMIEQIISLLHVCVSHLLKEQSCGYQDPDRKRKQWQRVGFRVRLLGMQ